jgi:hypothetical protein
MISPRNPSLLVTSIGDMGRIGALAKVVGAKVITGGIT